jgi:hypothetical protein
MAVGGVAFAGRPPKPKDKRYLDIWSGDQTRANPDFLLLDERYHLDFNTAIAGGSVPPARSGFPLKQPHVLQTSGEA